nr:3-deoxy-7-phosphoheptulonate synthase [Parasporobacterium sp.]
MIAVLKSGVTKEQRQGLIDWFKSQGLEVHISEGEMHTILGLVGDTTKVDEELIEALDIVESVKRISEPFKKANRKFNPKNKVIEITKDVKIGNGEFALIAGPCSVENEAQIIEVAQEVKKSGATLLRGGAFKPRTS